MVPATVGFTLINKFMKVKTCLKFQSEDRWKSRKERTAHRQFRPNRRQQGELKRNRQQQFQSQGKLSRRSKRSCGTASNVVTWFSGRTRRTSVPYAKPKRNCS